MIVSHTKKDTQYLTAKSIDIDRKGKILSKDENAKSEKLSRVLNKQLHLILLPTEKCNFRCTYCYEDFSVGRMNGDIISGIKAFLEQRCSELDSLNISWFGGEPLLAKDIVLEISEYLVSLVYRYSRLKYIGNMTTNGYLLDYKTATTLSNVGVRDYQISLDGPRKIHDKSRIRGDGSSTYNQIWSNLLAIRDSSLPVSVMLRLHFTADTFHLIDSLIEDIKQEFLPDPRFSIFFKAVERLGGPNDASINIFSESEKEEALKSLNTKMFGENFASQQNASLPDNPVCYASQPNSLVIRSNGDVGKCTVALYDERNKIASLQPDGTLKLIPGRLAPWIRGIETLDPSTLACPLVNLPLINEATSNSQKEVSSR